MELRIDQVICDLAEDKVVLPGWDAQRMSNAEAMRTGRRMELRLPATARNRRIVGFADDPHTRERFNTAAHEAMLSDSGVELFRGQVVLTEVSAEGFTIEVRSRGAEWAQRAAVTPLADTEVNFAGVMSEELITATWAEDSPVVFLPVHRDTYPMANSASDFMPAMRLMSEDDYRPFLNIRAMLRAVFRKAGYSIRSRFMDDKQFGSLYMMGAYRKHRTQRAEERMGFTARRRAHGKAVADEAGRVYADTRLQHNTLGNIVDVATPYSLDADGEVIDTVRNAGNTFRMIDGEAAFVAGVDVQVQFEYRLKYTTDHRILTRDRLAGFDTLFLGVGEEVRFPLRNRYEDRRGGLVANHSYRAVVFAHKAGARYRLIYTASGAEVAVEFAERTTLITTPLKGEIGEPRLEVRSGTRWARYTGDWALYDGYVEEQGKTLVEVRLSSNTEQVRANRPRFFNRIYFSGADAGAELTLDKTTSVSVRFSPTPARGDRLAFADVAQVGASQLDLIQSVMHLFNLRIATYTDERVVEIEPRDAFYRFGQKVDWRGRSCAGSEVRWSDTALATHEYQVLGYRRGEGAVERYNLAHDTTLGEWVFHSPSYAAKMGRKERISPLFAPALCTSGHFANAPSARVIDIGDRDAVENGSADISTRIVRYAGLETLPAGEWWGMSNLYPYAAFFDPRKGISLAFEDRDGCRGLNMFHVEQMRTESRTERFTIDLRLSPAEFASLATDAPHLPSLRSVFILESGHGPIHALLERTSDYALSKHEVRCTFQRILTE